MKKILFYSLIAVLLANASTAFAQNKYTLLEPLPCIEGTGNNCTTGQAIKEVSLNTYIEYVFKFAIALAVFLSIVVIIVAGFQYMLSEAFTSKSAAKERIWNAVIGLLSALAAYLILATIDPRLVQINSSIPKIDIKLEESTLQFQNKLKEDMNKLNADARSQVLYKESQLDALKKQKADIEDKIHKGEGDQNENYTELNKIDQQIKEKQTDQAAITAEGLQRISFDTALGIIRDPNSNKNGIDAYEEKIKSSIDKKVDPYYKDIIANNPEKAQDLQKKSEFFISQLEFEKKFSAVVVHYFHKDQGYKEIYETATTKKGVKELSDLLSTSAEVKNPNPELEKLAQDLYRARLEEINNIKKVNKVN